MKGKSKIFDSLDSKELTGDPFWDEKLTFNASTFGATVKSQKTQKLDDPYIAWKESKNWKGFDEYGCHHGRVRVESTWGNLTKTGPSPTVYHPKIDFLTKRETTPMITMSSKFHDDYEEKKREHKTKGMAYIPKYSSEENLKKVRPSPKKITKSAFENFSLEDMRNSMLPGPGSYDDDQDKAVKFDKAPVAFLPRRQRAAQGRNRIDFATLTINPDEHDFTPKGRHKLDPVNDPYKKKISYTIGERRKLLNQPEIPPTGPGYYNLGKLFSVGSTTNISQGPKKHGDV